jgi:hypothetical protein
MAARTAVVVLDLLVFLVPVLAGAVTSRFQTPTGEGPSDRLRWFAYAALVTIIGVIGLHLVILAGMLPRVPLASLYLPLGFVLGYAVHRVLLAGERPQRTESIILTGLGTAAVVVLNAWMLVRSIVA